MGSFPCYQPAGVEDRGHSASAVHPKDCWFLPRDLKSHSSLYPNEAQRCPFISPNNELMLLQMEQETCRRVRVSGAVAVKMINTSRAGLKFRQENTQAQHQVLAVPCDRREMPPVPEINRSGKNFITEMLHWRFLGFHRILSADILLGMDHWESIHTSSVLGAAVEKLFGIAAWKMPTLSCASIHQSLCNPNQILSWNAPTGIIKVQLLAVQPQASHCVPEHVVQTLLDFSISGDAKGARPLYGSWGCTQTTNTLLLVWGRLLGCANETGPCCARWRRAWTPPLATICCLVCGV